MTPLVTKTAGDQTARAYSELLLVTNLLCRAGLAAARLVTAVRPKRALVSVTAIAWSGRNRRGLHLFGCRCWHRSVESDDQSRRPTLREPSP